VAFWAQQAADNAVNTYVKTTGTNSFKVDSDSAAPHHVKFSILTGASVSGLVETDTSLPVDTPMLIVARYDGDTTMHLSASFSAGETVTTALGASVSLTAGAFDIGISGMATTLDEVATWDRYLSDDEVDTLMFVAAGTATSDDLVGEILDYIGAPADLRNIVTGGVTMSNLTATTTVGQKALDVLQKIRKTERGALYCDASGAVTFEPHGFLLSDPSRTTVAATFGQGPGQIPYRAITPDYSDQGIVNDVRATNTTTDSGTVDAYTETYSAEDPQSVRDYGRNSLNLDLNIDGDATERANHVADRMAYELDQFNTPHREIRQIKVGPFADSTHWAAVLALDLGARVAVDHVTPSGGTISQELTIEGIDHQVVPGNWEITFSLSPGGMRHPYWNLGTSGFSELGVTTWLGF
jgi:hypothetical protein